MIPSSKGMKTALGVDSVQTGKKYAFTKEAIARRDSVKAAPKPTATLTRSVKTVLTPKPKMKAASPGLKNALGVDSLQSGKFYPYTKDALAKKGKTSK